MRVLHVASGDLWAGAEVQLYNLVRELRRSGRLEIRVVLFNHGIMEQRLIEAGIAVTVLDETEHSSVSLLLQLIDVIKEFAPDVVHTHRQKENVLGSVASLAARSKSIRTVHGAEESVPGVFDIGRRLNRILDLLCGRLIQKTIVSVAPYLTPGLEKLYGHGSKVRTVENGIDIEAVLRQRQSPCDVPKRAGSIDIAFAGRLTPVKRVDVFVNVAASVAERFPGRFRFFIFGDGPLLQHTKSLIEANGLSETITLMGFRDNIPCYLSRMDLLLITSDHEGLPMILLEALALKVPVLAHAVGGIPRVLGEGKYGWLARDQTAESYSSVITRYLTNRDEFVEKADAGYAHLLENYSISRISQRYVDLYRSLV